LGSLPDVNDANISIGNTLADEVEINLNMLGALMLVRVGGEVDNVDVVAVDQIGQHASASPLAMAWYST
jgi:hypothetical protein